MYNIKKEAELYLVDGSNNQHRLDIYADITMSQTFDERSYGQKNLHQINNLHSAAAINKANPANFSFTTPILDQTGTPPVITWATTYSNGIINSVDLYAKLSSGTYKLEKAVVEGITFNLDRLSVITVTIRGTAKKLIKHTDPIPGTPVTIANKVYNGIQRATIIVGGETLDRIAGLNIEFSNDVKWNPYSLLNNSVEGNISYPTEYVVAERTVSGSITEYLTDDNIDLLSDASITSSIDITVGTSTTSNLLRFYLPSAVFTRRFDLTDVVTRVYDFRLNSNATTVKPIYKGV